MRSAGASILRDASTRLLSSPMVVPLCIALRTDSAACCASAPYGFMEWDDAVPLCLEGGLYLVGTNPRRCDDSTESHGPPSRRVPRRGSRCDPSLLTPPVGRVQSRGDQVLGGTMR